MKPSKIFNVLDLAWTALKKGHQFVPLFSGPPGIAKSYNVKKWAKRNDFTVIDFRLALVESVDFIGLPEFETIEGIKRTVYSLPEFWPNDDKKYVLFFDEPNRGTTSVMNALMQILTDRKVMKYDLPKNCLIVAACNPEDGDYEVNSMDTALKDRFVTYEIEYDKQDFISYMREQKWDTNVISFVESGVWTYVKPENLSDNAGVKYGSPRSLEKLNVALACGISEEIMLETFEGVLGRVYGGEFFAFLTNERPVTFNDLVKNRREALGRLAKFSDPKAFKNALISITSREILENVEHKDLTDILIDVCKTIPSNSAHPLITDIEIKLKQEPLSLLKLIIKNKEAKANLQRIAQ